VAIKRGEAEFRRDGGYSLVAVDLPQLSPREGMEKKELNQPGSSSLPSRQEPAKVPETPSAHEQNVRDGLPTLALTPLRKVP